MTYRSAMANARMRRATMRLLIGSGLCACLLAASLLATAGPAAAAALRDPLFSPTAQRAATLRLGAVGKATFKANNVITNVNFSAIDSLDQAGVQSFLAAQTGILDTYKARDHAGVKRSAAAIIWRAARHWLVSPKVILATLQKEQGLLSATKPSTATLAWAMGCGVPDSGSRQATYQGFGKQIWYGAESLRNGGKGWHAGISKVCGDGTVKPAARASLALYTYTPWIGVNGGGNKLFWALYCQYFADPLAVDAVAPKTTVAGSAPGWHDKAIKLTFSARDNKGGTGVAYTQYRIGAGSWTRAAQATVTAPASHANDGAHKIRYRSIDDSGNMEKARICTVKVDTAAPTTSVKGAGPRWRDKPVSLTFSAVDQTGASGVATTHYRLDGGSWHVASKFTVPAPASHKGDGPHSVLYRSLDAAGNQETTRTCLVRIDTRRPEPIARWAATVTHGHTASLAYYIRDPRPGSATARVTIRVTTPAGHLVRKLKISGVAVNQRLAASFVCHLAAGQYRFNVYATDAAGNTQVKVAGSSLTVR